MQTKSLKFLKYKPQIDKYLYNLFSQKEPLYQEHTQLALSFDYLKKFVQSGKTVRGSLFLESISELIEDKGEIEKYIPIAAGIELIHSALLIQDDFMDQDSARRGMQSLHTDLLELAQCKNYRNPSVYSPSAIMCVTDIIFFIAFEQLSSLSGVSVSKLLQYISTEYVHVGFSQWKDVSLANIKDHTVEIDDIEVVYKYKTARYTFVAPVKIAGILADADRELIDNLDKTMENIGMIFQIRDDYLNLFGDETITGKPVGGDIIEDKKTFYQYYLFKALKDKKNKNLAEVKKIYGKKQLTLAQIQFIQNLHIQLGVLDTVSKRVTRYEKEVKLALKSINLSEEYKQMLKNLLTFVSTREK